MQKQVKWKAQSNAQAVQYTDGTGDLYNVTFAPVEGLEIIGNGTLQAPLTVKIEPGFKLVRVS